MGADKKQAAEKVASDIRVKLNHGQFGLEEDKPVLIFGDYADFWITTIVPATCKESTVGDYEDILRIHVRPVLVTLKL